MILTKEVIKREIKQGNIKITPLKNSQIGPASIDLTLSNKFRIFKKNPTAYKINNKSNFKDLTKTVTIKNYLSLKPNELVHGITVEKINLADNLCGFLTGRSRFARLGLSVHITASFVQPGVNNQQVLEIKNMSPVEFKLYPGTRICQLILVRTDGSAKYSGTFKDQRNP